MSMHSSSAATATSSSVIYPIQLQDNDWPALLDSNLEAQTLLSSAIAHHEQYRDSTATVPSVVPSATSTSKPIVSHLHHKNDVNPTAKASYDEKLHYSEGENSGDDEDKGSDSKPAPKKAGRKPLTTEPTNKRKAQNRAAQRAFRERKERYVKSLEDRIKELEETHATKTSKELEEENMSLKVLVQKLETENYFLKEQSFTFDFPISQPGLYNLPVSRSLTENPARLQQQSQSAASTMQQHSPAGTVPDSASSRASSAELSTPSPLSQPLDYKAATSAAKGAPNAAIAKIAGSEQRLPWTPPSSGGDSVPNSPQNHDLPTPEQEAITHIAFSDNSAGVVPRLSGNTALHDSVISSLLDASQQNRHQPSQAQSTNSAPQQQQQQQQQQQHATTAFLDHVSTSSSFIPTTAVSMSSRSNSTVYDHLSPLSTVAVHSDNGASPTLEELANTPLFDTDKNGNVRFTPPAAPMSMSSVTTFEQTQALFTDFRDPTDNREFFADFEEPVTFQDDPIDGLLFNDQLLNYTNAFANVAATPVREESQAFFDHLKPHNITTSSGIGLGGNGISTQTTTTMTTTATPVTTNATTTAIMASAAAAAAAQHQQLFGHSLLPTAATAGSHFTAKVDNGGECYEHKGGLPALEPNEEAIPCPQAWEQIAKHPKFDDVEIDDLCAELKAKAKCSGHGPVISVKDVDSLISRLDRGE
ncbi:DNA-binding transcription factor yap1 [Actinomortierella ambigua]|nr:DNA-binding transcription factor yap1 [Actinomortierella ambigua]